MRSLRARVGLVGVIVLGALAVLALSQAVPYGRSHGNPRPTRSARFATLSDKRLFAAACGDCHSDRTRWPWYSNVAPMSWLVQNDVEGGRNNLNVSEWDKPQPDLSEVIGQVKGGGMPPLQYKLIHSGARLSKAERSELVAALMRLYRRDPPTVGGSSGR